MVNGMKLQGSCCCQPAACTAVCGRAGGGGVWKLKVSSSADSLDELLAKLAGPPSLCTSCRAGAAAADQGWLGAGSLGSDGRGVEPRGHSV